MSVLARQPAAGQAAPQMHNGPFAEVGNVSQHTHRSSNDELRATGDSNSVRANGLNQELAARWLTWQCKMIADVITGCVCDSEGRFLAVVPEHGEGLPALENAVSNAAHQSKEFIATEIPFGDSNGRLADIVATPVTNGGKTIAYVALLMTPRPQSRQNVVLQLLQLSLIHI